MASEMMHLMEMKKKIDFLLVQLTKEKEEQEKQKMEEERKDGEDYECEGCGILVKGEHWGLSYAALSMSVCKECYELEEKEEEEEEDSDEEED